MILTLVIFNALVTLISIVVTLFAISAVTTIDERQRLQGKALTSLSKTVSHGLHVPGELTEEQKREVQKQQRAMMTSNYN